LSLAKVVIGGHDSGERDLAPVGSAVVSATTTPTASSSRARAVLILLALAQAIMVLDSTVMNVSISAIVVDLGTTVTGVQIAITAYTLVMAAGMLTGGKIGGILGSRTALMIGLGVYGLGSLITAVCQTLGQMLVGWSLIEGLGATLVVPSIAALIVAEFSGPARAAAYGLIGGVAGASAAAGPLIGGWMTANLSWRYVFAAETVIVIGLIAAARAIPSPARAGPRPRLDGVGALLSAVGMAAIVFAVLQSSRWGWVTPKNTPTIGDTAIAPFGFSVVPFLIAAGVGALVLFAMWEGRKERRGQEPLLRLASLRVPQLRDGLVMLMITQLILAGTFFVLPLYLQVVLERDAFATGVTLMPLSGALIVAAVLGGRLAPAVGTRRLVAIGMLSLLGGAGVLLQTISPDLSGVPFGIGLAVFGAGIGLVMSQLGNTIMSTAAEGRASEVGGMQGTAQNLGASLGTALIGAILLTGLAAGFADRLTADPSVPAGARTAAEDARRTGLPVVTRDEAMAAVEKAGVTEPERSTIVDHYVDAEVYALKEALAGVALFAFGGLLWARRLPGRQTDPRGSTA
jgi:MFS family permease